MFFHMASVAADFFKFAKEDRYLGVVGDELRRVSAAEATNFLRQQADEEKYLTLVKVADGRSVGFDSGDRAVVNTNHSKNKFIVALDLNGAYALINDERCVYAKEGLIRRGDCNNPAEISYLEIMARPGPFEFVQRTTIDAGRKLDGFNPVDPLAVSPFGTPVSDKAKEDILLPYKERLQGAPKSEIADPGSARRILVKLNTL